MSISGDTAIVGALFEDTGGEDAGAVYLCTITCPPVILTQPVSVEQDTTNTGATIATVSDDLTPASSLIVSVESSPAGISVTNLINTDGTITADLSADCSAPLGANTVTLSVMDNHGHVTMADLTVNVTAETTAPAIACPLPPTRNNDAGQCSAVVNFTASARDNCDGAITPVCVPPSGSSFPVGITTVTCTATDAAGNSSSCQFLVTVNDTEAPFIVCPSDITAITPNPGTTTVVVNYTEPSVGAGTAGDNCGVASVVCNPPSGSAFPLGATTVTCTVIDTSGNSAECSFTVSTFDVCIEDDSNAGNGILFISTGPNKGTYRICCGGQTLTGRGTVSLKNGILNLTHFTPTRRVQAYLYMNQQRGSASLQSPPTAFPCVISDSNTTNNNCACSPD